MKKMMWLPAVGVVALSCAQALAMRVALLDFDDQAGMASDPRLGGLLAPGSLARKGVYLLAKDLVGRPGMTIIDRRDFMAQVEKLRPEDKGKKTPTRPSFIQAAQALRADAVIRGSVLSFSTGKRVVNQAGYHADFSTLTLRVALEALDPTDGSVIAMADGKAETSVRQTAELQTVLSEDDILGLLDKAINAALPDLEAGLQKRAELQRKRERVKLSIKTSADPALVEIDGILVGSTPVEGLEIYKGDHVLTIGKPGYQDITKRIMFEKDTSIEVPMIRVQLTASELKEVLEKMRMHVVIGEPALIIHTED